MKSIQAGIPIFRKFVAAIKTILDLGSPYLLKLGTFSPCSLTSVELALHRAPKFNLRSAVDCSPEAKHFVDYKTCTPKFTISSPPRFKGEQFIELLIISNNKAWTFVTTNWVYALKILRMFLQMS